MKELSIKEKAKRYDKAIELVNSKWHYKNQPCVIDVSEIFPELKESEDERIRKALISVLKSNFENDTTIHDISVVDIIAWLKKPQGKSILEIWKSMRLEVYHQASGNRHESNCSDDNTKMFSLNDIDEIIEKMNEQKPNDKVEPKFKVSDWIVFNRLTLFVNDIVQDYYRTTSIDGIPNSYGWDIDNGARVWTIEDAKDGDVLCYKDEISLYKYDIQKYINKEPTFGGFIYHCCYDSKKFITDSFYSLTKQDKMGIHPATKEQRNILFARMKEAGYRWDEDKKELIKL